MSRFAEIIFATGWLIFTPAFVRAEVTRVPFAGVYAATAGGGSLTGWDLHGGDNPGVLGAPGFGASLSGYAPFGLPDLRVTELEVSRDAARWGLSMGWRQLADENGPDESRVRAQGAWRWSSRASVGAFVSGYNGGINAEEGEGDGGVRLNEGWGAGLGFVVRLHRAVTLGFATESVPIFMGRVARSGLGVDIGSPLPRGLGRGAAWRMSAEYFRTFGLASGIDVEEWRLAAALRLHSQLGVYAGYAPERQTAALGVAFGIGGWTGHSAVQRHSALGGTAVQGLEWGRRDLDSP